MNSVDFLDKLLDGVVVEWKEVGEVAQILNGFAFESTKYSSSGIRVIRISDVQKGKMSDKDMKFYPANTADEINKYLLREDDLVMSLTGNVGRVAMLSKTDLPAALNQRVACIRVNEEKTFTRYLFHFFDQLSFETEAMANATGGGQKNMSTKWLSSYKIPIPCPDNPKKSLEIQAEIVRILDAFTELTAELTAELTLRKKQYNYYRDQLLSFEEGDVEWKTLGDVTKKWYSGGTPTAGNPEYYDGGDIPWLRTQEVKFSDIESTEIKITQKALEKSAAKWIPANCVIIAISGATAGRSAINKIPLTTNQHCGCLEIDSTKALYRYVFHWVSFNYENIKALGQGARGDLNSSIIKGFALPIPYADDPEKSLAEQARIVAILDKFDALTNSLTEGLPREIELRQKQYEYYRDLLLSFPKQAEVTG